MSLAGVQDKLPVYLDQDGRIGIPLDGTPSTHILKPDIKRLAGSVTNEAFCMTLAKLCGLGAAEVTLGRAGKRDYFLVRRYDRVSDGQGIIRRIHQEDFCQLLGLWHANVRRPFFQSAAYCSAYTSALLQDKSPTNASYLGRDFGANLLKHWDVLISGIQKTVAFLEEERIYDGKRPPTDVVVPVLSALWANAPQGLDREGRARSILRKYIWRAFLSNRYEKSTNSRAFSDYLELKAYIEAASTDSQLPAIFDDTTHPLPPEDELIAARWPTNKDRLARAILAVALKEGGFDLTDGSTVSRSNLPKREYHHLFPTARLVDRGFKDSEIYRSLNCALVTWQTNRNIAAKKAAPVADSLNMGGLAGLRKVADLKIEQDAARFLGLTTSILVKVEKALEPLSRNRAVLKGALSDAVMYDCRHAHDLINSLAAPLRPDVTPHLNWRPEKLPEAPTGGRCRPSCIAWVALRTGQIGRGLYPGSRTKWCRYSASSSSANPCRVTPRRRRKPAPTSPWTSNRRQITSSSATTRCRYRCGSGSTLLWKPSLQMVATNSRQRLCLMPDRFNGSRREWPPNTLLLPNKSPAIARGFLHAGQARPSLTMPELFVPGTFLSTCRTWFSGLCRQCQRKRLVL
jgi:hypothetical protein